MLKKLFLYRFIFICAIIGAATTNGWSQQINVPTTCPEINKDYSFTWSNQSHSGTAMSWTITGTATGTITQAQGNNVTGTGTASVSGTDVNQITVKWTSTGSATVTINIGGSNQDTKSVTVVNQLSVGTVSNNSQTIPYYTTPSPINCSAASGSYCTPSANYAYLWQKSIDGSTWNNLTTTQNLTVTEQLLTTTYYRRMVTETNSGDFGYTGYLDDSHPTNYAIVYVTPPFSTVVISPSSQNIFTGTAPAQIGGPAATGGSCGGSYTYLWQQSINGGSTWTNAPGTNNTVSYSPPALTQTTLYHRKDMCGTDFSFNNTVTVNVFQHLTGGTISPSSKTITYGTDPGIIYRPQDAPQDAKFTITDPAGGMCAPNYSYTWYMSTDNSTWVQVGTSASLDPGNLTSPVNYFKRKVVCNSETVYSTNTLQINVNPQIFPGTIYPSNIGIQSGTDPGTLYASPATGGACNGNFTYQWLSSTDGTTFTPITSATGVSYSPGTLIQTTYYKRQVTCSGDVLTTNTVKVSVNTGTAYYNYIKSRIITKAGVTDITTADALTNITDVKQVTQYFDGLGRPIQTVANQATPAGKDLVTINEYDEFGREILKYLPYASPASDGNFRPNALSEQYSFNSAQFAGEQNFYSRTDYESSPLNVVKATYAQGSSWTGSDRGVRVLHWENTTTDAVRLWTVTDVANNFGTYTSSAYNAGTLLKTVTVDENGKQVIEFKDLQGRVILKKVQNTATADDGAGSGYPGWLSTYYIYDDYSQLRCVVQPAGVTLLANNGWNMSALSGVILTEQCFRYEYDSRNRMVMKKVPGAGTVNMVYDQRDRPVFTQDAKMAPNNQWLGTLYDAQNRPVQTYMMTYAGGFAALQSYVTSNTGNYTNTAQTTGGNGMPTIQPNLYLTSRQTGQPFYKASQTVTFDGSFTSEDGAEFYAEIDPSDAGTFTNGYTVNDNPVPTGATVIALTITNYDGYTATGKIYTTANNSKLDKGANTYNDNLPTSTSKLTRGLTTSTKVRVIENAADLTQGAWMETASFYDDKGRAIQVQNDNYKGGQDAVTSLYSFAGQVLCIYEVHNNASAGISNVPIKTNMDYDAMGRLLTVKKNVKDDANAAATTTTQRIIAQYTYNELSQLTDKKIGQKTTTGSAPQSTPMEDQVYGYNIRGWLQGINKDFVKDVATNYFGFELGYDKAGTIIAGTNYNNPAYNGNISGTVWKNAGDGEKRKYDFTYDAVNRLTAADFNQYTSGSFNKTAGIDYSVSNLQYDDNGNIKTMQQQGWKVGGIVTIDNLQYNYIANTNKLLNVIDASNDAATTLGDFRSSSTYMTALGGTKTTAATDYSYDANGNLGIDKNKDITGITYNYLNLPYTITVSGKGTITYIYDAIGNKLEKRSVETNPPAGVSGTTTTTYLGSWVYQNNVLQYFGMEEGRIRPVQPNAYNNNQVYAYDYLLKDHLGNTRVVLTDELQQDIYPAATLEGSMSDNNSALVVEDNYYTIDVNNIADAPAGVTAYKNKNGGVNATDPPVNNNPNGNPTANSLKMYKLNGSGGAKTGLGIALKVMAGDKIDIWGNSYYQQNNTGGTNSNVPVTDILSGLLGSPAGATAGKGATVTLLNSAGGTVIPSTFLTRTPPPGDQVPNAYINYIFFDEQFKYVSGGFSRVGSANQLKNDHHNDLGNLAVPKNGYIYVYVSNQSPVDVFFDNLQVVDTRGPLLETDNYYPFGLMQAGISSRAAGKLENKTLYNGKEIQNREFSDGSGLEWEDYGARMYDGQIGRWGLTDPLSDKMRRFSPYAYCYDNPIRFVDPDGMFANFYDNDGNRIGTDGEKNDDKYIVLDKKEAKQVKATDKKKGTTQVSAVSSAYKLPTKTSLTQALKVLNTEVKSGGTTEEIPSLVMKDGSVIQGASGPGATITVDPSGATTATAPSSLPSLPSGATTADVETTIHPHPTTDLVKNGVAYPFTASGPADEVDTKTFKQYPTNIIVGRLGDGKDSNGNYGGYTRPLGIVIYTYAAAVVEITQKALERILKN